MRDERGQRRAHAGFAVVVATTVVGAVFAISEVRRLIKHFDAIGVAARTEVQSARPPGR